MLLRDIFTFTKPFLDAFRSFGLISRACQGPRDIFFFFNIKCYFLIFCNISCDFLIIVLIIAEL